MPYSEVSTLITQPISNYRFQQALLVAQVGHVLV
jgi:hypothetical protein